MCPSDTRYHNYMASLRQRRTYNTLCHFWEITSVKAVGPPPSPSGGGRTPRWKNLIWSLTAALRQRLSPPFLLLATAAVFVRHLMSFTWSSYQPGPCCGGSLSINRRGPRGSINQNREGPRTRRLLTFLQLHFSRKQVMRSFFHNRDHHDLKKGKKLKTWCLKTCWKKYVRS